MRPLGRKKQEKGDLKNRWNIRIFVIGSAGINITRDKPGGINCRRPITTASTPYTIDGLGIK